MPEQFAIPSRPDAWNVTRTEKMCILFLMNTVSAMFDARDDLADRVSRIEGGPELMETMVNAADELLKEVRRTIPERQRTSINNISKDMEMRMVPKMTPSKTNVICGREDFRQLVDAAQIKCRECTEDSQTCNSCELYQVLTTVLPMDRYDDLFLCPYNMAGWEN